MSSAANAHLQGTVASASRGGTAAARLDQQGKTIDRLARLYQRARLAKRRALRQLGAAVASGGFPAIQRARARSQRAGHWEVVLYERYVHAVLAAYA